MEKVRPYLWFDDGKKMEEAVEMYTSLFSDSEIIEIQKGPDGNAFTGSFKILGHEVMVLNGGPYDKLNPAISLFVMCKDEAEVDKYWEKLSESGEVLMELAKYPFSEKYGWVNDKYGVSWQIGIGEANQRITPSLLFVKENDGKAQEAIDFYISLFENSKVNEVNKYEEGSGGNVGNVMFSSITLDGSELYIMDGGLDHEFQFNNSVSLFVSCKDQEEVDKFWNAILEHGGTESMCGWIKDKYGVMWQIIPDYLMEVLSHPDPEKAKKAGDVMMKMHKIIVKDLEDAVK